MKKATLLSSLLLLAACSPTPESKNAATDAESLFTKYERYLTAPRTYVAYRPSAALKIDGKLDEASWQQAASTEEFEDISGAGFAKPKYATTAKMLWDDEFLYVGAILEEEDIKAKLTQRDTIIYHDNDFEVFIDPDSDTHHYFEIENNARGVIFDLQLDQPYRVGGNFYLQWHCPGIQLAVHHEGTLNNNKDKDKYWSVEMAIPQAAITKNFVGPLKAGNHMRINFSRVQWLKPKGPEENWVWTATGRIDMHMPDRWGYLQLSPNTVGTETTAFKHPYHQGMYKLLWAMYYAQADQLKTNHAYFKQVADFGLTETEKSVLPANAKIDIEATDHLYRITITDPATGEHQSIDNLGFFRYGTPKKK